MQNHRSPLEMVVRDPAALLRRLEQINQEAAVLRRLLRLARSSAELPTKPGPAEVPHHVE